MSQTAPKIDEIMAQIRERAKEEVEQNGSGYPRHEATRLEKDDRPAESVLYSQELNYLNANWSNLDGIQEVTSHRKFLGPVIVKIKSFFVNLVLKHALKEYFKKEQDFNMNLVNFLNANARYIDSKNTESFWQIMGKIDNDVSALNDRMDILFDELRSAHIQQKSDLEKQVLSLKEEVEALKAKGGK